MNIFETFFNIPVLIDSFPMLMRGLGITITLGALSIVLGLILGLIFALIRTYGPRSLRWFACGYIDIFRSIPILVLLVIIYYALPFVGIRLSAFAASVVTLSLVSSAYTAEIFRSGIEAIPKGQVEASLALGYRFFPALIDIILPQAIKIVIPPLTSNCINVVKDTALASVVAMPDLLKQATQAQALAANPSPLIGAAIIYLVILLPLVHLVSRLERYLNVSQKK